MCVRPECVKSHWEVLTIVANTNIVMEIPSIVLWTGWSLGRLLIKTQQVIAKRTT